MPIFFAPALWYATLAALPGALVMGSVAYLLLLLAAAASGTRRRGASVIAGDAAAAAAALPQMTVLVPAHDEEMVLADTLRSLRAQDYPPHRFAVVVIADNCTDRTAEIARACGADHVWERADPAQRGKGYALEWSVSRLLAGAVPPDAVAIVDADTLVAPDFLSRMAARLAVECDHGGRAALQGRYGVLNTHEGWRAALMGGAFDLYNHVKPLGRDYLGLSAGLKGNGMAFTRPVLEAVHWQGRSVTEDIDYGLDLLEQAGVRVGYVPEARVEAQMPTTARQATSQRSRWEGGRYRLLRRRALPLLLAGLRKGDVRLLDAAISLIEPPLAELAALLAVWGAIIGAGAATGLLARPGIWAGLWAGSLAGFVIYIVGGLRVAGAPPEAFAALWKAPGYAVWKFALYTGRFGARVFGHRRGQSSEWVRTDRTVSPTSEPAVTEVSPPTAAPTAPPPTGREAVKR